MLIHWFSPAGTNNVASNANPDNIIQPQRLIFLPHRFRVKIRNVYAGISTTPDITKLRRSLPPRLDACQDSP